MHGCLQELQDLLAHVHYRPENDRLVFVGDLVDRGPDPAGVVRFVRELAAAGDVLVVQGNHEEKLVRWFKREAEARAGGPKNKMHPPPAARLAEWTELAAEERAWLESLPIVGDAAPGWLVVHGGFDATSRAKQLPSKMLRCRWIDAATGKMKSIDMDLGAPPGTVWWAERWAGPEHVVYGHAVHSLEEPRVDKNADGAECWGIDTGCVFGGRLTALTLETRALFQVPARAKYAELNADLTA